MNAVVVWIDHEHAKLYSLSADHMSRETLRATYFDHHALFRQITERLRGARGVLILGPGTARSEFLHYLQEDERAVAERVVGCEPADHPSNAEIAAFASRYFQRPLASQTG